MKQKLIDYFSRISPLTDEESAGLIESMQIKTFKKGDFVLKQDQPSSKTYFVLEGCIREYLLTDGEEKTTHFYTENQWAISANSFTPENTSKHNWICSEETALVEGDEQRAQLLFSRFPRFESISRTIMEAAFAEQKEALSSYYTDTPEQRYLKLSKSRPDLLQRVPQYQLASYIGVKPESLSRIRKRIASTPQ